LHILSGGALPSVFISSLIDTAFVDLNSLCGDNFWDVCSIRFFSNFFASITVVPVIVTWSNDFTDPFKNSKKLLEAIALALIRPRPFHLPHHHPGARRFPLGGKQPGPRRNLLLCPPGPADAGRDPPIWWLTCGSLCRLGHC
jgi:hypothetical protein